MPADVGRNIPTPLRGTATTVLLNNNTPIETVSKLLGHSKITTTLSYYAEVMPSKLKLDLEGLKDKLSK
jgi:integrase